MARISPHLGERYWSAARGRLSSMNNKTVMVIFLIFCYNIDQSSLVGSECVILAGKYFTSYRGVELWSPGGKCNRRMKDLPGSHHPIGLATMFFDQEVLVCGGKKKNKDDANICLKLNPETEEWEKHSTLLNSKSSEVLFFAHVVVGKKLFILGGERGSTHSQYLEAGSTTWQKGPELPKGVPNQYGCAAADSDDSFILISQGSNIPVYRYNVSSDAWATLPNIPNSIYVIRPACGHVKSNILVAFRDNSYNSYSMAFDVNTQTWSETGNYSVMSASTPILDVSGRFFKIGYNNPIVEEYLPYSRTWKITNQALLNANNNNYGIGTVVPKSKFKNCL